MQTVLVVEDEPDLRGLLRRYLERDGFAVVGAATGAQALREAADRPPDVVLLDLGLPDIDGSDVLRSLAPEVPVVVLTARSAVGDRIAGLRDGASDYVTKPFSPTEVILRIRAVLGRQPGAAARGGAAASYGGGRLTIEASRHEASLDGRPLAPTPGEWALLTLLASRPHQVFSRSALVEQIGGMPCDGYERTIDTHVKNLRRKLGEDGHHIIETVTGFGYRLGLDRDA